MRRTCFLAILLIMQLSVTSAAQAPRVRILDPAWAALFENGTADSATLRELAAELERSDVIVHIVKALPNERKSVAGLQFVVASGGARFLRIRVSGGLPDRVTLGLIGHELQHALEVAREPAVVDEDTLRHFYRRVGISLEDVWSVPAYDTIAARQVQRQVLGELEQEARARDAGARHAARRIHAR